MDTFSMLYSLLVTLLICVQLDNVIGAHNLFANPSVEDPVEDGTWACPPNRCTWARTNETAHTGSWSLRVTNRNGKNQGMEQSLTLEQGLVPNRVYYASAYIKFTEPINAYHQLEIYVQTTSGGVNKRTVSGKTAFLRPCDEWVRVGGDFKTAADTTKVSVAFVVGQTDQMDYYMDSAMLVQAEYEEDWKDSANKRIEKLRKGDVTFKVNVGGSYNPENIVLWNDQTKQAFPLGASVGVSNLWRTDEPGLRYQEYIYKMFNWMTFSNAVKYRFMESVENQPSFYSVDRALKIVQSHGITNVRGHSVTWGKEAKIVGWLKTKTAEEITPNVYRRCDYLAEHFGDSFKHWDVNNEAMHGHWYEDNTGNWQFTPDLMRYCHSVNKGPKYLTNDFNVISNGVFTAFYQKEVSDYVSSGVPINGMGIQAHLSGDIDIARIKARLDLLATAGVPLWITEFDIRSTDLPYRAGKTEDALRLFFSHPAVEGVILWSFWDGAIQYKETALVTGDNFEENEAGAKVRELFLEEWRTKESVRLSAEQSQTKSLRVFYGTHNLVVLDGGDQIGNFTFEFKRGQKPEISINIGDQGVTFGSNL